MAKKKGAKKKNNVSKHILKSREDETATSSENRKSKANTHTKHPEEAASYLTQWKASKNNGSSSWKFNKNTQSWLIRHMYEVDKVPKSTFLLLLEYLEGLEGKSIIDRMRIDATRRCRRHKEYCKNSIDSSISEKKGETEVDAGNRGDINETSSEKSTITKKKAIDSKAELEYEQALWSKLDDHEKRKQYKRARKILDLIKKGTE